MSPSSWVMSEWCPENIGIAISALAQTNRCIVDAGDVFSVLLQHVKS